MSDLKLTNSKATSKLKFAIVATMALFTLNGVPEGKRHPKVVADSFTEFFNMNIDPDDGLKLVEELLKEQEEEHKQLMRAMMELANLMQSAGVDIPDASAAEDDEWDKAEHLERDRYPDIQNHIAGINPNIFSNPNLKTTHTGEF